jgi:hypothetical protein
MSLSRRHRNIIDGRSGARRKIIWETRRSSFWSTRRERLSSWSVITWNICSVFSHFSCVLPHRLSAVCWTRAKAEAHGDVE